MLFLDSSAHAQSTTVLSMASNGTPGNGMSQHATISADGAYVVFVSQANTLGPSDANSTPDVYGYDLATGGISLLSVDSNGIQADAWNGWSEVAVSANGRFVAFDSSASNLVSGDSNNRQDVFIHDRQTGATDIVSITSLGAFSTGDSGDPSISADGRFVAFSSNAEDLVPDDTNDVSDVFLHDTQLGTTVRVSIDSNGAEANDRSAVPSISGDGRYVAFQSLASTLVALDTNISEDVFVHDRLTGSTLLISKNSAGTQGNLSSIHPSISADGRYIGFVSAASNLDARDADLNWDAFVRDTEAGTTEIVSLSSSGLKANDASFVPTITDDGRYVLFRSAANNLVSMDTNGRDDVFVRDRERQTTERVTVSSAGVQANDDSDISYSRALSNDGRRAVFWTEASNLVSGDIHGFVDVFLRDRGETPPFTVTPLCFGDGSGAACPCANTGDTGRSCNNSISTGGALLTSAGDALLSADSLHLTSAGERATALSVFWQANLVIEPRVFGDGVGCLGGQLKRLYYHNAIGGTVSAPQGGDLSVSARSAALGSPISPGAVRLYQVFYRDGAPEFCDFPAGSSFNTSNGLRVLWGS